MAANATQSVEQVEKVPLRVLVDKERNKVLYAEAGKDFIDVLFSFITLPLGTIARLVAKESNIEAVRVGSLSSLYQSVADLDEEHLWTENCKEMLLQPRNSMEAYCRPLKLNIDDTEPMQYLRCRNEDCNRRESGSLLSTFRNQKCFCGKVMDTEVFPECSNLENGFVKETATFIISDDLHVMPSVFGTVAHLLQKYGIRNVEAIEEQTLDFSMKEVVDLLKFSLLSKTPLTDFILKKKQSLGNSNSGGDQSEFGIRKVVSSDEGRHMDLKVMVRKSNGEILFAEAEEDFADFLFSFLTFPLGGVLHVLEGFSSLSCIDNLYKSMNELSPDRYLISQELKDELAKPQIAPQFELSNQILPIGIASLPVCYCHTYVNRTIGEWCADLTKQMVPSMDTKDYNYHKFVPFELVDPKFSISKSSRSGEFAKGPSMYMVTADLVVTPMSSVSAMLYLNRSKVPLFDVEEKVIKIGLKEGLCILKACLTSTSALKGLSILKACLTSTSALKVDQLKPETNGHTLTVKVVSSKLVLTVTNRGGRSSVIAARPSRIAECLVGDETGTIVFTARNEQVDLMQPGSTLILRNAKIDMFKGSMRLAVDRRGCVEVTEPVDFKVKKDNNLSLVEYELVNVAEE